MLTIYTYAKCSTCRAATKWLRERGVPFEERPIRETPPSLAELRRMLAARDGEIRRLFNTSEPITGSSDWGKNYPASPSPRHWRSWLATVTS